MKKTWALVLAAGEGKRMCSSLPKVLHPICGKPMLFYILGAAASLVEKTIIIVGRGAASVKKAAGSGFYYVHQKELLGTGHAVAQALPHLPSTGRLLVLCGDTPLLEHEQLGKLLEAQEGCAASVAVTVPPNPGGYGRIVRDEQGVLEKIVEERDASEAEKTITEINTGTYCFDLALLKRFLPRLDTDNAQGEYYLPDLLRLLRLDGHKVAACQIADYRIGLGVNNRVQLAEAAALIRDRINRSHMLNGVTITDPGSVWIDHDVIIGPDTIVLPGSLIEGRTAIGASCSIGPAAHIRNSRIEEGSRIAQAAVFDAVLEKNSVVAPFNVIGDYAASN